MRHSPQTDRPVEIDGARFEPEPVVLAHRLDAAAEVDSLRADGRREQLGECRRQRAPLVERAQHVLARGGMDPLEERQDLVADQPRSVAAIRRVAAPLEPALAAVRLRLLAPDAEERPHDAVVAAHL